MAKFDGVEAYNVWKRTGRRNIIPKPPPKPRPESPYHRDVWFQISARYRTIARLPEGMTGKQALRWAEEEYGKYSQERWGLSRTEHLADRFNDSLAASHFLRCYTCYPFAKHLQKELSIEEFRLFRAAGGRAA